MKINFSFCGAGFTGIYHLGVIACLRRHGQRVLTNVNKVAGVSSGSQIGTCLAVDPDKVEECVKFTHTLAAEIRSKRFGQYTPRYNLYDTLRQFFEQMLPPDAYRTATDRMYISLTNMNTKQNELVHDYSSNEELIQCIIASSNIPGYSKLPPVHITYRGQKYKDGGFTDNLPVFPEADGRTILVSPFYGRQDISPSDKFGKRRYVKSRNQDFLMDKRNIIVGIHALFPPRKDVLDKYYQEGFNNAKMFLKREELYDA